MRIWLELDNVQEDDADAIASTISDAAHKTANQGGFSGAVLTGWAWDKVPTPPPANDEPEDRFDIVDQ